MFVGTTKRDVINYRLNEPAVDKNKSVVVVGNNFRFHTERERGRIEREIERKRQRGVQSTAGATSISTYIYSALEPPVLKCKFAVGNKCARLCGS